MPFGTISDFKKNDVAFLNGKEVKIVSSNNDIVVVEDAQGNRLSVRKDVLMSTPLFNFASEEAREERKEKIAYYQDKAKEAGKEKMSFLEQVKELWTKLSGCNKNDEMYTQLKDEYWEARFAKTAAGNREYSAYLDAFLIASDPIA